MRAAVQEQRRELRASRRQIDSLRTAAAAIPTAPADSATVAAAARDRARLLSEVERHLRLNDNRQKRIDQFLVEIHKKFSIPVACMVFVLLGAPLGAVIRRRGLAVSAAVSLAFFWVYWVFLIGGEELADRGYVGPALAMWAPNLLFGLLGLLLTHRTAHDRPWLARARRRRDR
jgi:lipopolysaccharide export system permease protein